MRKGTIQYEVHKHLREAARFAADGARIIQGRADRVDALDSIRLAEQRLLWAKHLIDQTFMPRNEPKWPKP